MDPIAKAIEQFAIETSRLEDQKIAGSHESWWRSATVLALGQGVVLLTLLARLTQPVENRRSAEGEERQTMEDYDV